MFKTKKTINGRGKGIGSIYNCIYCSCPIPIYRTKGNIKYRPWFCSSTCSKFVTPKMSYANLKPLKDKFIKDGIAFRNFDWLNYKKGK